MIINYLKSLLSTPLLGRDNTLWMQPLKLTPSVALRRVLAEPALGCYPINGKRRCLLRGGRSTGPKIAEGRAQTGAAQLKHGRYVNWREKRPKERH